MCAIPSVGFQEAIISEMDEELIQALSMKAISHREVSCYGISAKEETYLDAVLEWLISKTMSEMLGCR